MDFFNKKIGDFIPSGEPKILFDAMRYSLTAGGKRIRPILVVESAKSVKPGIDINTFIEIPVACEFIHTYSLIHDDLPAMDDDDFRRGKPTCHKVFGEAMAILAGDGLLTHAFNLISLNKFLESEKLIRIINILSEKVGIYGMVAGQAADMDKNFRDVEFIHTHKTAKFIEACCEIGGVIGSADESQIKYLRDYGYAIGMAFQIWDDVLDEIGEEEKLGKKAHKDKEKDKITYPLVYGVERSKEMARNYVEKAITSLKDIPNRDILVNIAKFIISREV
ncbi:MAG: polyprenyl synthetase family protein [Hydrogenothermaceae bacterium]|nr:polyprenyl synthetase family protein [Hydrogenothermaceae bacterium]